MRAPRRGTATFTLVALPLMIGMAALAVDAGLARQRHAEAAAAADLIAFAAAGQLNGTEVGMSRARMSAVHVARHSSFAGDWLYLPGNWGNDPGGQLVLGTWDRDLRAFIPNEDPWLVNAVQVRIGPRGVATPFAEAVFGVAGIPVSARTIALARASGARAVPCYLPIAIPSCLFEQGLRPEDIDLRLGSGDDNIAWARVGDSVNAAFLKNQIDVCMYGGTTDDPVYLQNGVVATAMSALRTNLEASSTRWVTDLWGVQPAQMLTSRVDPSKYGRTYEGAAVVFDSGVGGNCDDAESFTSTADVLGFTWIAIYDVDDHGTEQQFRGRIDATRWHDLGTGEGAPNFGVGTLDDETSLVY